MRVADLHEIHHYWSSEPILEMTWYKSVMPRDRFTQITQYFHCSDNMSAKDWTDPENDKLHKGCPDCTSRELVDPQHP